MRAIVLPERIKRFWPHALLLVPIVALACWFRLHGLGSEHLYGDEAEYAIVARFLAEDLLQLRYPELSSPSEKVFVSQPPLVLYMMAAAMRALGPTDFAALLPTALLGVATAVGVYAIGWRLGGPLPAAVGGFLVAVLPFHVSMSRNAMLDVGYAFFIILTIYFLIAWLQERRARQAVGIGVAAACAALSKLPGVLMGAILLAVLLFAIGVLVAQRLRGQAVTADARRLALHAGLVAVPIVVGAGLYLGLVGHLDAFEELHDKVTWNVERVSQGEGGAKPMDYYLNDKGASFRAQLGPGIYGLALAGLGVGLGRALLSPMRQPWRFVLPLTTALFAAFFLLSERKIAFYLLPFAPLAAALIGNLVADVRDLLIWGGVRFTRRDVRRYGTVATVILAVAVLGGPASAAVEKSYVSHVDTSVPDTFGYGFREAAKWIDENDPDAAQMGTTLGRFTLRWYNDHVTYHQHSGATRLNAAAASGELRYIVVDPYATSASDLRAMGRLLAAYDGELAVSFEQGWGRVDVYRLGGAPTLT